MGIANHRITLDLSGVFTKKHSHTMMTQSATSAILHKSTPTANLHVDRNLKLLEVEWLGKVHHSDYQNVLLEANRLVKEEGIEHAILNRLKLDEISPDSALWLKKEFIKEHLKPIIGKLKSCATVEAKSAFSRFYSNSLTLAVKVIYPSLSIKSFPTKEAAMIWMGLG